MVHNNSSQQLAEAKAKRSHKINKVETTKQSKNPMEVYARLEEIAAGGYDQLDKADSTYFLKCFGLYDKGEDFMLRVRVPAGQLSHEQARRVGEVARDYGRDYIDLSTRMQFVLRYIAIEDIAVVLGKLKEVGLSTFQTGVDNPRNIVADPLDGIAYDSVIPTQPIVEQLEELFIEKAEWVSALPRKFNTGILGSMANTCNIYGHDCGFVLAQKNGVFGFNVYLGGKVGKQAQDADCFITSDEVPHFYGALLEVFRDFGYQDNRNKNRLYFLVQDVGLKAITTTILKRSGLNHSPAGAEMVNARSMGATSGKVLLRDGHFAWRLVVPSGVFSGTELIETAQQAQMYGTGELRLTYDQNIYIIGINPDQVDAFESTEFVRKYDAYQSVYFQDMIACAGTHTCSFGVIPNKPDAAEMATFLNATLPLPGGVVRMNWSACPKGCGIHGIADIGFEGCKAKDRDGHRVDGVHISLGGKITQGPREAYTLLKSIPLVDARYYVLYLLELYAVHRKRGESFETFEYRYIQYHYSYQAIAFYARINFLLRRILGMKDGMPLPAEPSTRRVETYEVFDFGLRLFEHLSGEKRYEAVEDFEPVLARPRSIKPDTLHRLNSDIPMPLSEAIYRMTHEDRAQRAKVFTEVLATLKGCL